jgi:hypothetical protein
MYSSSILEVYQSIPNKVHNFSAKHISRYAVDVKLTSKKRAVPKTMPNDRMQGKAIASLQKEQRYSVLKVI